jgi:hypothetical protein
MMVRPSLDFFRPSSNSAMTNRRRHYRWHLAANRINPGGEGNGQVEILAESDRSLFVQTWRAGARGYAENGPDALIIELPEAAAEFFGVSVQQRQAHPLMAASI